MSGLHGNKTPAQAFTLTCLKMRTYARYGVIDKRVGAREFVEQFELQKLQYPPTQKCTFLGVCTAYHQQVLLRGDFLQNRVLGAQNQSDARMRN